MSTYSIELTKEDEDILTIAANEMNISLSDYLRHIVNNVADILHIMDKEDMKIGYTSLSDISLLV